MANPATSNDKDAIVRGLNDLRDGARGNNRERALAMLGRARGSEADSAALNKLLSDQTVQRPFARRKRLQFAASGSPSTMVAAPFSVTPRPRDNSGTADVGQQLEDDGVLFIDEIAVEFDGNLKHNTLKELRNKYGLKIYFEGDKKTRTIPLADVMEAGNLFAKDAGVDNATAGSEAVVAGTHHIVSPPRRLLKLLEDEIMIILPGESAAKVEFVLLPEYASAPTLTGETADLYCYVTFYGERLASKHERF